MRARGSNSRSWLARLAATATITPLAVFYAPPAAQATPNPISVTMTAAPNPVQAGSNLTYTITTVNNEPQVTNVRLTDQLTGLKNVVLTSSRGYCTESQLLVTCSAGSMPGQNTTWTVTISGIVTAANGTFLNNTASVAANWSAQNVGQDYLVPATTRVQVGTPTNGPTPELGSAISGPSSANPGSDVLYQVTVYNSGSANASDILTTITLPNGFTITPGKSVVGTNLFTCDAGALPVIACTGGAVNFNGNATITVPARVNPATTPAPTTLPYKLTAAVDPENAITELDETNNTSSYLTSIPGVTPPSEPMTFTKTVTSTVDSTGSQARPNDTLTYTLTVKNTGTAQTYKATRVEVTDGTQGLDAASVTATSSDSGLVCTPSATQVKCIARNSNYTLSPGAQVVITVRGRVVQPPSSLIVNTATLQALQNKVSIQRTATGVTMVRPGVELSVTNYATCTVGAPTLYANVPNTCGPFRARNQLDYLITVGNSGLDDATGVVLRVPLANDVIFESSDNLTPSAGFTCAVDASNVVKCTGGTIPGQLSSGIYAGTTRQVRIHLTAPNSTGPITAVTTVDPYNSIYEPDEQNNTFTTTTPIATGIDLVISQAVRCPRDSVTTPHTNALLCDPVAPSGTLIYDILVQNLGTQDASGIKVSDILPTGTRFRAAKEIPNAFGGGYTPPHGLSCTSSGTQVDCTGGRLNGIYKQFGNPLLTPATTIGIPDNFTIEVTLFAPAPFGPNSSTQSTVVPTILNQTLVDPDSTIAEIVETNDLNVLETNVAIPPAGDWGTFNELTVANAQANPASGAVAPNGTLDYTLTVSNWGSDPVTNVTVLDYVPDGARFRNVTAAPLSGGTGGFICSYSSGVVSCANGALAASPSIGTPTSTTITIRLFAPPTVNAATTQYTNHAVVDPSNVIAEANETNNVSDVSLTVALPTPSYDPITGGGQNTFNDLVVVNTQSAPVDGSNNPVSVAPNGTLKYRLTVKNRGSDPVNNVTVADYVPQGSRFRDAQPAALSGGNGGFTCAFDAGVLTCTNGTLTGGGSTTIDVLLFAPDTVNYDGGSGSFTNIYTNHAVADPSNTIPEADETNNADDETLLVENAPNGQAAFNELQVSTPQFFPNSGPVAPGGTLVYNLTVSNQGSDPATHVVVKDYLPTGTTYRLAKLDATGTGAHSGGFVCSQDGGVVTCANGTLGAGEQALIKLTLFAPAQPSNPGSLSTITNQVVVDPDNTIPEGNETNNTATQDTGVEQGGANSYWDLTVSDNGSDTTGTPDGTVKWKIDVRNLGTDDLFNATVRDILPAGVTFVAAGEADGTDPGRFSCAESGGVVTCTGGTVRGTANGGAARTINIVVQAPHQNVGMINQVVADPDNTVVESDESNNAIRLNTIVQSVINLSIELDTASISQGSADYVTGRIKNNIASGSGEDAHHVLSVWNLPVGVTVIDVQAPAGTGCTTATDDTVNQVTCTTDTLAAGGSAEFKFYVYQNSDKDDNDNAIVNGDRATVESDSTNDSDSTVQSQVTQ